MRFSFGCLIIRFIKQLPSSFHISSAESCEICFSMYLVIPSKPASLCLFEPIKFPAGPGIIDFESLMS